MLNVVVESARSSGGNIRPGCTSFPFSAPGSPRHHRHGGGRLGNDIPRLDLLSPLRVVELRSRRLGTLTIVTLNLQPNSWWCEALAFSCLSRRCPLLSDVADRRSSFSLRPLFRSPLVGERSGVSVKTRSIVRRRFRFARALSRPCETLNGRR